MDDAIAPDPQTLATQDLATPDIESPAEETPKPLARVFSIANQKGGVGKTTTAINLATGLAAVGKKVLIFDLDPQGNASTGLGIDRAGREISSYDVLMGYADVDEASVDTLIPNLRLVPSTIDLSGAELELIEVENRSFQLKNALALVRSEYDYVLIDCPPSLNLLTVNALVGSSAVLVPLQCEFFALEGLSLLMKTIERIRAAYNPELEMHGVVLTMFDRRNNLSGQVAQDVRDNLGDKVYDTVIPRNVRISEAPSHGKPAIVYDYKCSGSRAYMRLASEMLRREKAELAA